METPKSAFVRDLLIWMEAVEYGLVELRFRIAWLDNQESGCCDDYGSAEFHRVFNEWQDEKCPVPVEPFIRAKCNQTSV